MSIIVRAMTPYVGETMARSATEAQCQKLGVADALPEDQQEALLARLGGGLNVFLGRERASEVVAEMRAGLRAAEQA